MTKTLRLVLPVLLLIQSASALRQHNSTPLALKDCDVQGIQGKAKCGTLEVYEDRAARTGRKINLNIIVLPATSAQREPDPLFYFAGAPCPSLVSKTTRVPLHTAARTHPPY